MYNRLSIRNVHKIKLDFHYEFRHDTPHRTENLACLSRKFITHKFQFYFVPVHLATKIGFLFCFNADNGLFWGNDRFLGFFLKKNLNLYFKIVRYGRNNRE